MYSPIPQILLWHDKDCVTFMTDCSYGDSIDDVEGLIGRHQEFVEGQMPVSVRGVGVRGVGVRGVGVRG